MASSHETVAVHDISEVCLPEVLQAGERCPKGDDACASNPKLVQTPWGGVDILGIPFIVIPHRRPLVGDPKDGVVEDVVED